MNDILLLVDEKWSQEEYAFVLSQGDIDNIIKLLKSYSSETWKDSIWDWDDEEYPYSEYIQQNIKDLQFLRELMDKYDLKVYFYNSY